MTTQSSEYGTDTGGKMQPVLLSWAILLMVVLTLAPFLLVHDNGKADHLAAALLMWSMSAAFVRGFGFIPKNRLARYLLGTFAALAAALAAILRLTWG